MLTRRAFLLSSTALAVASCSGANQQVPTWVAAFQAVAEEFQLVLPQLKTAGLSGSAADTVTSVVAQIEQALGVIGNTSTQAQGQSTLVTVEQYVNNLAPLVLPFVSLIPGGSALGLIVAALPAIELAVNLGASLLSSPAQQLAASAPASATATLGRAPARAALTPQQALDLLLAKHGLASAIR